MCVIIDVNVLREFVFSDTVYQPIHDALKDSKAKLAIGGYLIDEYQRSGKLWSYIVELERQGRVRSVNDREVRKQTDIIRTKSDCRSDDHHIIALAIVGNVRLLCTDDKELIRDFKNSMVLSRPRGKIYRNASHSPLIKTHCRKYN